MLSTYQVNKLVCKYAIRGTLHNLCKWKTTGFFS